MHGKVCMVSKYNFVGLLSIVFVPFGSYLTGRQTAMCYCVFTVLFYMEVAGGLF